jgi:hypothetical protein
LISCACTSAAHASRGLPRPTCACHPMSVDNQCHGQAKASQGKPRQAKASHGKEWHSPDPSGSMPWRAARRAAPLATPRRSSGAPS